ncbi:Ku protein [Devosia algicola]|uniref:Ku protein n=1 Tax=Devosia algicola TaxID=3026418 RepID=A0ABY7YLX0_9HYPH|nr:Ku protein [Devosia algicola]WDR02212.1 Ku protein [Devosia algicola]
MFCSRTRRSTPSRLETRKTLELTQFVGSNEIDPLYFDKPYYIVPSDDLADDAFVVIRDALRQTDKIGLGQLTLRGKEYLVALKPAGRGLLLETLHYEAELRNADPYFSDIPVKKADPELLEVATALIDKKSGKFDAGVFKDHYQVALRELIARKLKSKGRKITAPDDATEKKQTGSNVVDLMAALKSSLESGKKASGKKTPAKKVSPRKKTG